MATKNVNFKDTAGNILHDNLLNEKMDSNLWNGTIPFSEFYTSKNIATLNYSLDVVLEGEGHTIDAVIESETQTLYDPNVVHDTSAALYVPYNNTMNSMVPENVAPLVDTSYGVASYFDWLMAQVQPSGQLSYNCDIGEISGLTIRFKSQSETNTVMTDPMMDPMMGPMMGYEFDANIFSLSGSNGFSLSMTGLITDQMMNDIPITFSINGQTTWFNIQDRNMIEWEIDIDANGWRLYKDGEQIAYYEGEVALPYNFSSMTTNTQTNTGNQFIGFLSIFGEVKHTDLSYVVSNPPYYYEQSIPYEGMEKITFSSGAYLRNINIEDKATMLALPNLADNVNLISNSTQYIATDPENIDSAWIIGERCGFMCSGEGTKGIALVNSSLTIDNRGIIGDGSQLPCISFLGNGTFIDLFVNNEIGYASVEPTSLFSDVGIESELYIYGNAGYSMPADIEFSNFNGLITRSLEDKTSNIANESEVEGNTLTEALNTLKNSSGTGRNTFETHNSTTYPFTVSLDNASAINCKFTGNYPLDCILPDATTLTIGFEFDLMNKISGGTLNVYLKDGTTNIASIPSGIAVKCFLTNNSSTNGVWDTVQYYLTT